MLNIEAKKLAIELRKRGFSYSQILKDVNVAKSTLSIWLRSVGLSIKQKQALTKRKIEAILRGAMAKKEKRINLTSEIINNAKAEIGPISLRELWLIGVALYWAEGSKQSDTNVSTGVIFSNMNPSMIKLFIIWLENILKVDRNDIYFEVYIHRNLKNNVRFVKRYWSQITGFPIDKFTKIYYKKDGKGFRKNTGKNYFGLIRIKVKKSANLFRKISGWMQGIADNVNILK